ncbi:MAG: PqiC family protein [Candidatus Omnitrophota bacterium]
MKKQIFYPGVVLFCGLILFVLSGCICAGSSPSPRFYMLKCMKDDGSAQKFDMPAGVITSVGPVNIPQYLDRPQIVTVDGRGLMGISQFDRWSESLDSEIARAINLNLSRMLPGGVFELFPCNFAIPLNYQLIVEVMRLEADLKNELLFVAQWSIIDADAKKMVFTRRSEFTRPVNPHNYSGLADALSGAVEDLSAEIAKDLSSLAKKPKAPRQEGEGQ